jgi:hypothetical protein
VQIPPTEPDSGIKHRVNAYILLIAHVRLISMKKVNRPLPPSEPAVCSTCEGTGLIKMRDWVDGELLIIRCAYCLGRGKVEAHK